METVKQVDGIERLMVIGSFFGYPECCIDHFIGRTEKFETGILPIEIINEGDKISLEVSQNGFIPCPTCAEKIQKGEVTLKELISKDRRCPLPFPHEMEPALMDYLDLYSLASEVPESEDPDSELVQNMMELPIRKWWVSLSFEGKNIGVLNTSQNSRANALKVFIEAKPGVPWDDVTIYEIPEFELDEDRVYTQEELEPLGYKTHKS